MKKLILALVAFFFAGFVVGIVTASQAPAAVGAAPLPACSTAADIARHYAPEDEAVFYSFTGDEAAGLIGVFTDLFGPPPGEPVKIVLAYATVAGVIDFYLYDTGGCFIAHVPLNFDVDMAQALFDALGITLPIGHTFYKLPGTAI
jgi:hypothetical protein